MTEQQPCLRPFSHRGLSFKNRLGLSPLTRGRAGFPDGKVNDLHVDYYTQRSTGGFVITEVSQSFFSFFFFFFFFLPLLFSSSYSLYQATGISRRGLGWYKAPGIYTDEQVEAWKKVTESVHKANGLIFCQLWHMGRFLFLFLFLILLID